MNITLTYALYSTVLLAFSIALGIAWAQTGRRGYLGRWALFSLFYFVGTAVNLTPDVQSYPLLIALSYTCFYVSYRYLVLALGVYAFGPDASRRTVVFGEVLGLVGLVGTLGATLVVDAFPVRYFIFNAWSTLVFVQVAVILFLERGEGSSRLSGARNWFSLLSAAFTALAWSARAVTGLLFSLTSSQFGDSANVFATAAVAFWQILFTASLFNLAERRVAEQLASLGTASIGSGGLQSASELVTGIAHALGSPLGSAVTTFSAIRAHLEQQQGEDRIDLTALDMVEAELARAVSRLKGLRLLFQDSGEWRSREHTSGRDLGEALLSGMDAMGIRAHLVPCGPSADDTSVLMDRFRAVHLILEFVDLARRASWMDPHHNISLRPGCTDADWLLQLEPFSVPPDIWRDISDPLQRPGVKHFADTLALAMLQHQFADSVGLALRASDRVGQAVVSLATVEQ